MGMYLAAILGLSVLTTPAVVAIEYRAQSQPSSQETQPTVPAQDAPRNAAPATPSAQPGAEPQSQPPAPEAAQEPPAAKPEAAAKKPEPRTKAATKKRRRRKTAATTSTATPEKKVVRNGGTADPAVQLAPGMSAEQASSQRHGRFGQSR